MVLSKNDLSRQWELHTSFTVCKIPGGIKVVVSNWT
jgi:hypothetical protein